MGKSRKHKMINTIIFDLGKVILNFDYMISCKKFAKFSKYSAEEILEKIYHTNFIKSYEKGHITSKQFYRKAAKAIKVDISYENFCEIFSNIFTENKPVTKLIKKLSLHNTLVLLSNTYELHFQNVKEKFSDKVDFNFYILSYKEGVRKPDKMIFQAAVNAADVKPQECIYIDDMKPFTDVASTFGMHSVNYTPEMNLEKILESKGVKI